MTVIHIRADKKTKEWTFGSADPSNNTVIVFNSMVVKRFGSMKKWTERLSKALEYYVEIIPGESKPNFIKTVFVSTRKETIISPIHYLWTK